MHRDLSAISLYHKGDGGLPGGEVMVRTERCRTATAGCASCEEIGGRGRLGNRTSCRGILEGKGIGGTEVVGAGDGKCCQHILQY